MADVVEVIKGLEEIQKHLDTGYSFAISWESELIRDALELLKIRQEQIKKKTDKIKKLNKKNKELMEWIDHQNKVISALEEELQKERWE